MDLTSYKKISFILGSICALGVLFFFSGHYVSAQSFENFDSFNTTSTICVQDSNWFEWSSVYTTCGCATTTEWYSEPNSFNKCSGSNTYGQILKIATTTQSVRVGFSLFYNAPANSRFLLDVGTSSLEASPLNKGAQIEFRDYGFDSAQNDIPLTDCDPTYDYGIFSLVNKSPVQYVTIGCVKNGKGKWENFELVFDQNSGNNGIGAITNMDLDGAGIISSEWYMFRLLQGHDFYNRVGLYSEQYGTSTLTSHIYLDNFGTEETASSASEIITSNLDAISYGSDDFGFDTPQFCMTGVLCSVNFWYSPSEFGDTAYLVLDATGLRDPMYAISSTTIRDTKLIREETLTVGTFTTGESETFCIIVVDYETGLDNEYCGLKVILDEDADTTFSLQLESICSYEDVCDDEETETWFDWSCGLKKAGCFFVNAHPFATRAFNVAIENLKQQFPLNIVFEIQEYSTDYEQLENASSTEITLGMVFPNTQWENDDTVLIGSTTLQQGIGNMYSPIRSLLVWIIDIMVFVGAIGMIIGAREDIEDARLRPFKEKERAREKLIRESDRVERKRRQENRDFYYYSKHSGNSDSRNFRDYFIKGKR